MKTNQLMSVAFDGGSVEVFHKTAMGDLTQLWNIGNRMRVAEGKRAANITLFLNSGKTQDFISVIESSGVTAINKTGRGKSAKTYACLELMIYAAEYLSTDFHVEVIRSFIRGKILEYRDESGDNFKAMNIAIDNHLPGREGKDNKGLRIQVAKTIKEKINPSLTSWNFASADELRYRASIEDKLTSLLDLGVVKDWEHMKELICKL